MIRDTIAGLGPKVLASRMVRDYVTTLYTPAAASTHAVTDGGAAVLASWKRKVRAAWPGVAVDHVESLDADQIEVGSKIHVTTLVRLGELTPGRRRGAADHRADGQRRAALRPAGQPVPRRGARSMADCAATRAGSRPSAPERSATRSGWCRTTRCWPARPRWAWPLFRPSCRRHHRRTTPRRASCQQPDGLQAAEPLGSARDLAGRLAGPAGSVEPQVVELGDRRRVVAAVGDQTDPRRRRRPRRSTPRPRSSSGRRGWWPPGTGARPPGCGCGPAVARPSRPGCR